MVPDHQIWKRVRNTYHGGAIRGYCKSPVREYGRNSPLPCQSCATSCATNKKIKPAENQGTKQVADSHLDFLDQIDLMIQEQDLHKGQ